MQYIVYEDFHSPYIAMASHDIVTTKPSAWFTTSCVEMVFADSFLLEYDFNIGKLNIVNDLSLTNDFRIAFSKSEAHSIREQLIVFCASVYSPHNIEIIPVKTLSSILDSLVCI